MQSDLLGFVVGAILFIGILIWGAASLAENSCLNKAETMGLNHKWFINGGCIIETEKGKWIPLKNYRALEHELD